MLAPFLLLCAFAHGRAEGRNPIDPAVIPVADFDRDSVICEDICIDLHDRSSGAPTAWEWSFPGATPASSSQQNPTSICYGKAGIYTIRLIASNADGSDTVVKTLRVRSQQITLDSVVGRKGLTIDSMQVFTTRCDSIAIRNGSTRTLTLYQPLLVSGKRFSLTPEAFPLVIPPGETRKFQACFSSVDTGVVRDQIVLLDSCATIVVPLVGRTLAPPLKAGFGTTSPPCDLLCLDFTDSTIGTPIRWLWRFPGSRTDSSTEQNPRSICYDSSGTYRVTLIAEGRFGRDTTVRDITVERRGTLEVMARSADGEVMIPPTTLGTARCDSIMIANTGSVPYLVPSARMLDNRSFSAAPGEFPMLIPAGGSRGIAVCYAPSSVEDERDTLVLEGCKPIIIPLASRGVYGASAGAICDTRISLRVPGIEQIAIRPALPYPNPGSTIITLPMELLIPLGNEDIARNCVVIDQRGTEVGRGMYTSQGTMIAGGAMREEGTVAIDVTGLPAGLYHAVFTAGDGRIAIPIVVQR